MTPSSQALVATDPPHGEVAYEEAAAILRLSVADVVSKTRFPAPEVLAAADGERARGMAGALASVGLDVRVVDSEALARAPWPTPAASHAFEDDSLVVRTGGREIRIGYGEPVVGVSCRPPSGFAPPERVLPEEHALSGDPGPALTEPLEWVEHLDLYVIGETSVKRFAIVDDVSDAVRQCERRFERITMDRRLEDVRPRQRFIAGQDAFDLDMRKAFSFGTLLLRQLLDSVSADLRDLTQYEYGSRLAFAMAHADARSER